MRSTTGRAPARSTTRGSSRASKVVNAGGQVGLVLLGAGNQALVVSWSGGTLFIYWYSGGTYQGNLTTRIVDAARRRRHRGGARRAARSTRRATASSSRAWRTRRRLTSGTPGIRDVPDAAPSSTTGRPAHRPRYQIVASVGAGRDGRAERDRSGGALTRARRFTITSDPGFSIADVLVDAVSVGTPTGYTFTNVQANHTLRRRSRRPIASRRCRCPGARSPRPRRASRCRWCSRARTRRRSWVTASSSSSVANLALVWRRSSRRRLSAVAAAIVVAPLGGNRWSVDEVTLGTPCGTVGSGTLFTLQVTSADVNGVGTITIVSATAPRLRQPAHSGVPGRGRVLPIDEQGPAATADLHAIQAKTGQYVAPPAPSHVDHAMQLAVHAARRCGGGGGLPAAVRRLSVVRRERRRGAHGARDAPGAGWTLVGAAASRRERRAAVTRLLVPTRWSRATRTAIAPRSRT